MEVQLIDEISTINSDEVDLKPIKTKKNDGNPMFGQEDEEEELLSPSSRMFHEPNYNINIVAIMGWKAPNGPNLDLIKNTLTNTVLKHPHFSSVQVLDEKDGGKIRWVTSQVNLDNHIIVPKLEGNMDLSQDKIVDDYVSNLSRTPMDKSKPLWELHIIMFKHSNSSSKILLSSDGVSIFRIHHSLGDGISLVSILLSCTRKTSDPNSPPTLNIPNIKKNSTSTSINQGPRRGLFCKFWCYFMTLWLKIKLVCHSMVDLMMFVATVMFLKDTETPIKSFNIDKNNDPAYRRFVFRTVNLDDIKFVKNATNATVNDVVLGVIQAGLSSYLNRRYASEEEVKKVVPKTNKTPSRIKCRATVLINLRPLFGTNATDEKIEKNIKVVKQGNCFGFVLLPLKISMADNPLDHVRNAKATMDRKKQSLEVIWTSYILDLLLKLFGYKAATNLAERVPLQTTLAFSNVMGPTEEISFCDHPMTFMAATCYGQPSPLMIHVVSYTNKMTFAISVDERTIPDPYQFGENFVNSLQDMKKAVVGTNTH